MDNKLLEQFLRSTWKSPVFGDTFSIDDTPHLLAWAEQQLSIIATAVASELTTIIAAGMPDLEVGKVKKIVRHEILPKTLAFCPALTIGEVDDIPRLSDIAIAVGLMYWGDQTTDRGDTAMPQAIELLSEGVSHNPDPIVAARLKSLKYIKEKITHLALPEDVPYVLACFYDQVLLSEVVMHRLSQEYLAAMDQSAFLSANAEQLARITTMSAGFPSISSSLYAIYRQHNPTLPPLSEVYQNHLLTDLLQVSNVVVRLWDELGDWRMDAGQDPSKGLFVINPFNQYDPVLVRQFCELAFITNDIDAIQRAFQHFHDSAEARQKHGDFILNILRSHIRHYLSRLSARSPGVSKQFEQYIILCKRVAEIGYVNRVGDIALTGA